MERISYLDVDKTTFIERFERPNYPAVITDCQLDWDARKKWTIEVCAAVQLSIIQKAK